MIHFPTPVRPQPGTPVSARRPSLPLLGVRARGRLDGLLFSLEVEQRYRNDRERPIEAVFTFPVPLRAALLGLELELGERRLEAVAVARREATERYEKAIDAGDAAVLLESAGNGLHTVSVGNLKPGETAVIRYRHAELLDANRGLLRLQVPTVIAPRYGNPGDAGLDGPAVPGTDLLADYPFDIELLLAGIQDDAALESPTHSIRTHRNEGGTSVQLAKTARMDRDFVLEVPHARLPKRALVARDGDEWVVLASAVLPGLPEADWRALALTVVLDCSGSMAGDSIEAARRAVGRVLESLDPRDRFGLLRFGSTHRWETEGLVHASRDHVARLRSVVHGIEADLGGTEMRTALEAAVRAPLPRDADGLAPSADLLLITDGQVHELERIAGRIAGAGRRLFVVAVGSAPNEALARRLSELTGGACEFIDSGELAEDAILRMFRRMRARPRAVSGVEWPASAAWVLPPPKSVFPDETVHLVAGLRFAPHAAVRVTIGAALESRDARSRVADGAQARHPGAESVELALELVEATVPEDVQRTLVRVAAARRISELLRHESIAEATALAVRHQLATSLTSFVVVAERAEADKVRSLPATVAVPHALPAGCMGVSDRHYAAPMMTRRSAAAAAPPRATPSAPIVQRCQAMSLSDLTEIPRTRASRSMSDRSDLERTESPPQRLDRVAARRIVERIGRDRSSLTDLLDLVEAGVDVDLVAALRDIADGLPADESQVLRTFLEILLEVADVSADEARLVMRLAPAAASAYAGRDGRELRRAIRDAAF